MIDRQLLLELVDAGIRASSPDNSQPWKFKLLDDGLELRLNSAHLGMFFDPENYASLLGCGGVIENIRLFATDKGYDLIVTPIDVTGPFYKVANLRLIAKETSADPLSKAIYSRCTHRGFFYRDKVISPDIIEYISDSVETVSGANVHWFLGKEEEQICKIITSTDRLRYTHKALHHDFYSKLRFGNDIEKKRDGLAADTLGLETLFIHSLPLLKSWRIANLLNCVGMHHFMAFRGAKIPLENAAKIGALVMPQSESTLVKGKVLNRLWLAVNSIDELHFQPFGAFPLFIYRMKQLNGDGFNEKQKQLLHANIEALESLIGLNSANEGVVILFRIGYAPEPKAYARRRPIESFLVD